jgi:hypothetical protein
MARLFSLSCVVIALAVSNMALASNPQVDALRQQVKVLRAEQKVVVKVIEARYEKVIQSGKLGEKELAAEKRILREQEKSYLALGGTAEQQNTIRDEYRLLQGVLSGDIHVDAAIISKLRAQKSAHTKLVSALYKAKIAELDNLIRIASKRR